MASTVNYHINMTAGAEHSLPCVKCSGKTAHKVLASVDERGSGSDGDGGFAFYWAIDNQVVQCLGCKAVSFRKASQNSEDENWDEGTGESEYNVTESLYPSRIEGMSGIGDDTIYLPANIRRIYEETLTALSNRMPVLAGIGLRALLESVCKEKNAAGKNLEFKIDSLVSMRVLTPNGAAILHKIRGLGNKAAHEVMPHTDRQLELAMTIVEHLIKDVYILPKQAASQFGE